MLAHPAAHHKFVDLRRGPGAGIRGGESRVEADAQVPVGGPIKGIVFPFEQDGQVLGLLHLHEKNARTDGVWHSRRHVDTVAGLNFNSVHRRQHCGHVLGVDPTAEFRNVNRPVEAEVHGAAFEYVPGLGFTVLGAYMLEREGIRRVHVYWKALTGVEEFDEHTRVGAEGGHVLGSQPVLRMLCDGIPQGSRVGELAEADLSVSEERGGRPDPVFGNVVAPGRGGIGRAEVSNLAAATVKPVGGLVASEVLKRGHSGSLMSVTGNLGCHVGKVRWATRASRGRRPHR